jgi:outer membrane protein
MEKLLPLALLAVCGAACAQAPSSNPMPDGSRDMYLGLGALSAPRWEGADARRVSALPVLQVEWSNGIFIAGMSAGMHLSRQPSVEFGPLLAIQPRRSESGNATGAGGIDNSGALAGPVPDPPLEANKAAAQGANRLIGMEPIATRLTLGGFFNYYLTPELRLTNSLLYGSGNGRDGARWSLGLQRIAARLADYHSLSLSAGVTMANRNDNQAFFGVTGAEARRSGNPAYAPAGGLRDVQLGARWNWALTPGWMLTSGLQATRLLGSAKDSPLVKRPTDVTLSSALAYRF